MVPVSEKKKKTNQAWDDKNMKHLVCKVRNETAADFKKYAEVRGTSVHSLLKGYVERCLAEDKASKERGSGG